MIEFTLLLGILGQGSFSTRGFLDQIESQFFFEKSDVTRRMLIRLAGNCQNRCVAEGNEGPHSKARKHLQVMDQCIEMHRKWSAGCKDLKMCGDFSKAWLELEAFLRAAPPIEMRCILMHDTLLEVEVLCFASIRIGNTITHPTISTFDTFFRAIT